MSTNCEGRRGRAWPFLFVLTSVFGPALLSGQTQSHPAEQPSVSAAASDKSAARPSPNYLLSFDDGVVIQVQEVSEIPPTPLRIDKSGYVRVPLVGRIKAAGLTVEQFEAALKDRLKTFVLDPEVTVLVSTYRSQPVSVLGAVKNPGTYQLEGSKTLVEMLALAGGLDSTAGGNVEITRQLSEGALPLPNATERPGDKVSVAEVHLNSNHGAADAAGSMTLKPFDVIRAPRARMIYVVGQVNRAGGFPLQERESLGVLQAIALAGGLDPTAAPQHCRVLRAVSGESSRAELPVNLRDILDGEKPDYQLQAEDILFIPTNVPKKAMIRAVEMAVQMGTGVVIFRR